MLFLIWFHYLQFSAPAAITQVMRESVHHSKRVDSHMGGGRKGKSKRKTHKVE